MFNQGKEQGYNLNAEYDVSLLTSDKEIDLLRVLGEFPQVIAVAADKRIPHKMTQYVFELSSALHSFYNAEKVLDANDVEQTKVRISLMQAVKIDRKSVV